MLKKIKNFRDLGGIPAADGKKVQRGMLYRSAHLCALSPAKAKALRDQSGIRTVIDLRSPSEVAAKKDIVAEGVKYLHLPPLDDEQNPSINRKNRRGVLYRIMAKEGGARRHLSDIYRAMVTQENSLEAFGTFAHLLNDHKNTAVLWHCTQGKDRTGIATAVILMALGVDRAEIMRDYLRTNRSARFKNTMIYLGVLLVTFSKHTADELDLLLTAHDCYLEAAFEEIDRVYGGTEAFLDKGIGLTSSDITKLKKLYLV